MPHAQHNKFSGKPALQPLPHQFETAMAASGSAMVKMEAACGAAAPAGQATPVAATPVASTPLFGDLEQSFLACAPANMPSGPLLIQPAEVSYEPPVAGDISSKNPFKRSRQTTQQFG
jgi:hypothetical protein